MAPKPPTLPDENPLIDPAWWYANRALGAELRRILAQTHGLCRLHGCEMIALSNGFCSAHQADVPPDDWWIPYDEATQPVDLEARSDSGPDR